MNKNVMTYDKNDALMTRGFAILQMVILHLFCRKGADVYGTPLIWLNDNVPFVYWFGFFANITVCLYTICAGYARQLSYENGGTYKKDLSRVLKVMKNYWIVLCLFCVVSIIAGNGGGYIQRTSVHLLKAFSF